MKTLFIETHSKQSILPSIQRALSSLKNYKKIGIITTVQHINHLNEAKSLLEKQAKKVFIGQPKKYQKQGLTAKYAGQVLGCDASSAKVIESKVDCFLYIGTGEFHPLAIALATDKPVFKANPFTKKTTLISTADKRRWLVKQAARISKFKSAKNLGIYVSTKSGQNRQKQAEQLGRELEKQGKKAYLFLADTITANEILNFPQIDCWVNTACPRIVDDHFSKPVVNIDEI